MRARGDVEAADGHDLAVRQRGGKERAHLDPAVVVELALVSGVFEVLGDLDGRPSRDLGAEHLR